MRNELLEATEKYRGKPSQLNAFLEGVRVGATCENATVAETLDWADVVRGAMEKELDAAKTQLNAARIEAQETLKRAEYAALEREQKALNFINAERAKLQAEAQQNPKHLAAKHLMLEMLELAGYNQADISAARRKEVPSAVLCHIATMVAAVAGENPVSIQFGAMAK